MNDLRIFERVATRENFASAARDLDLSPAAVTRAIAGLEKRLGVRLFTRTTRLTRLTQDGETFLARCRAILAEIEMAEAEMRALGTTASGTLKLCVPISFGRRRVAPRIQEFRRRYPGVLVQLFLTDRSDGMATRDCDLSLRVGPSESGDFITRRVLTARRAVVAAPSYLAERGTPRHPDDLRDHAGLGWVRDEKPHDNWMFVVDGKVRTFQIPIVQASNSGEIVQDWALAGCGVALKSLWDVAADLDAGRLVELLHPFWRETADMYLVYPDRRNLPARTRLFIDFLVAELAADEARLRAFDAARTAGDTDPRGDGGGAGEAPTAAPPAPRSAGDIP